MVKSLRSQQRVLGSIGGEELVEFGCYDATKFCYELATVATNKDFVIFPGTVKVGTTLKTGIYRSQAGNIQTIADGSMMRPKNDGMFSFQQLFSSGFSAEYGTPIASAIGDRAVFLVRNF